MDFTRPELAEKWNKMTLNRQLLNVGSEISRANKWRKEMPERSLKMVDTALELLNLTKLSLIEKKRRSALREVCRAYEVVADFYYGDNEYNSTPELLQKYFDLMLVEDKEYKEE